MKFVRQREDRRSPVLRPWGTVAGRGESSLVIALEDIPATFDASKCPVAH